MDRTFTYAIRQIGGPGAEIFQLVRGSPAAEPQRHHSPFHHAGSPAAGERPQLVGEPQIVYARRFRHRDVFEMATYRGQLEHVIALANAGELGCTLQVTQLARGGVRLRVVDRWFDGDQLTTTIPRECVVEGTAGEQVAHAAERAEELRHYVAQRNAAYEQQLCERAAVEMERADDELRSEQATVDLGDILGSIEPRAGDG